ncbi:hypothetical protein EVJ58_g11008 [Rhodofomes roseus]|uniref:Uncharacterized protein n=1 Tax=Rhodofomes roseus TaxID=34475 RepID=A0A4Y9XKM6_9APHY|nr:hypothetical protein EVJ58_g11008 [Rhodofomes roseus]
MSAPTPITDHTAATVMSTAQPTHGTAGPWYMYWVNPATMAPIQNPFLSFRHYWDYHNATGSSNDSGCNFNAMDQESVDEDMVNSQAKPFECMPAEAYEGMTDEEILETFDQRLKAMEEKWTQLMAEANEDMTEEEILQNLDQRLTAMEEMWAQLTADAEDEVTDEETLQTLDERLAAMEEHLMQMIARAQAHN